MSEGTGIESRCTIGEGTSNGVQVPFNDYTDSGNIVTLVSSVSTEWCHVPLFRNTNFKVFVELGKKKNHGTQDSRVVPHRGTNWAALWLTVQIKRDAVLSKSYGRG